MNENVEALERRVSRAQTDEEKTRALNDLAWAIGNDDPQRALALSQTAYELATAGAEETNKAGAVESLMNLGRFHYQQSRLDQAQGYLEQVLALVPEVDEEHRARLEARALMGLGLVRWRLGDYAAALRFYLDSLEIHRTSGDADGEATVLNNLGIVYGVTREYEHALDVYRQSLQIYEGQGKEAGYSPGVPVILSSGYGPGEIEERFNGDGPTAFLQKPYTVTTLLDMVRKYLPQHPQREPSFS